MDISCVDISIINVNDFNLGIQSWHGQDADQYFKNTMPEAINHFLGEIFELNYKLVIQKDLVLMTLSWRRRWDTKWCHLTQVSWRNDRYILDYNDNSWDDIPVPYLFALTVRVYGGGRKNSLYNIKYLKFQRCWFSRGQVLNSSYRWCWWVYDMVLSTV